MTPLLLLTLAWPTAVPAPPAMAQVLLDAARVEAVGRDVGDGLLQPYSAWTRELALASVSPRRSAQYRELMALVSGPRFQDMGYEGRAGALLLAARMSAATDDGWALLSKVLSDYPDAYCADVAHLLAARLRRFLGQDALAREHYGEALRLAMDRQRTWVAALEVEAADLGAKAADTPSPDVGTPAVDQPVRTPSGDITLVWQGADGGEVRGETEIRRSETGAVRMELPLPGDGQAGPWGSVRAEAGVGALRGDALSFWCYPLDDAPDLTVMVVDVDGTNVSWALRRDELQPHTWNEVTLRFAELRNGNSTISNDIMEAPRSVLFAIPAYETGEGTGALSRRWVIDDLRMSGASPAPVGTEPLRKSHPLAAKITDTGDQDLWTGFSDCTVTPDEATATGGPFCACLSATERGRPFAGGVLARSPWAGSLLRFRVYAPGCQEAMVIVRKAGEIGTFRLEEPRITEQWTEIALPLGEPGPVELVSFYFAMRDDTEAKAYVDDVRLED